MELLINSFIDKRNFNFINNNYELLNINDDYNLNIYYLNDYKCKIILRKFNNYNIGWEKEIQIKLFEINNQNNENNENNENNHEIISIGSCKKNYKLINLKTKVKLIIKKNKILKIPKIIYQTYKNNNYHNYSHFNSVQSLIDFNPDYQYYFYNDIECREFIQKHYNENILNTYDLLYPVAYKADLFRYLIIYKYGGIYIDNKYLVRKSFDSIINENDQNLYCLDTKSDLLFNSLLISCPENINFKYIINNIVNNINNNFYGLCPLHPTGPRLFYEHFKNETIRLKHIIKQPSKNYLNCRIEDYEENILLNTFYEGYYHNKNHRNQIKNDYDFCHKNKFIYLKPFIIIDDYKFSILINKNIKFNVELIEDNKNEKFIKIKLFLIVLDFNKKINNNYKFIFIHNKDHNYLEFNLIDVINKILIINY
jgi:mannosyltransferase OCH1-like enzyme